MEMSRVGSRIVGERIGGTVHGVPVAGYWTGLGVRIEEITDGKPLDTWISLSNYLCRGRIDGATVVEITGEYLIDEDESVTTVPKVVES